MGNESETEMECRIVFREEEQNGVGTTNNADSTIGDADVIANEDINIEARTPVEGSTSSCISSDTSTAGDLNIEAAPSTANAHITRPSTAEDNVTSSTSGSDLPPDPVKDWWNLAHAAENSEARTAWETMLQARSKLKEYSTCLYHFLHLHSHHSPTASQVHKLTTTTAKHTDSALLLQTSLLALPSPNTVALTFLTHWLETPSTGNFPHIGQDREVWSSSPKSSPIAISPRSRSGSSLKVLPQESLHLCGSRAD
jgi:hypothetical protein